MLLVLRVYSVRDQYSKVINTTVQMILCTTSVVVYERIVGVWKRQREALVSRLVLMDLVIVETDGRFKVHKIMTGRMRFSRRA